MDLARLDELVPLTDPAELPRVLSRDHATRIGISPHVIQRRLSAGRWKRVLPRTYLTVETLTWADRLAAASAFAGARAVLSGAAVLHDGGLRSVRRPGRVLVLVPPERRLRSTVWVQIRPTCRLPDAALGPGSPRVPVARAVADHALTLRRIDDVRAVVAEAVRRQLSSVDEIAAELDAGPRNGSVLLRQAVDEVGAGAWSAPEARAARLLRRAAVPPFEQNARIDLPDGGYYVADFLWRELRAILEIDSVEHHFDLADWEATMDRHLVLETLGFSVTHRPPTAIRDRPPPLRPRHLRLANHPSRPMPLIRPAHVAEQPHVVRSPHVRAPDRTGTTPHRPAAHRPATRAAAGSRAMARTARPPTSTPTTVHATRVATARRAGGRRRPASYRLQGSRAPPRPERRAGPAADARRTFHRAPRCRARPRGKRRPRRSHSGRR